MILTFNLSDFPRAALLPHGVEARHPDHLFAELLNAGTDGFCAAVRLQRQGLKNPPVSVEALLAKLETVELPQTAAGLRQYADRL